MIVIHSSKPSSVPLGGVVDMLLVFVYSSIAMLSVVSFSLFLIGHFRTEHAQVSQSDRQSARDQL